MKVKYLLLLLFLLGAAVAYGQEQDGKIKIEGRVYNSLDRNPLKGVDVSAEGVEKSVTSDEDGHFTITVPSSSNLLTFKTVDFHIKVVACAGRTHLNVYLVPLTTKGYSETMTLPFRIERAEDHTGSSVEVYSRDFDRGRVFADEMLIGNIPGVRTLQKSGMPGEGNLVMVRGTRSLIGSNTPLVVIDGMPVLPDTKGSSVFTGYSKNILRNVSLKEVNQLSIAKGFDAAPYGSMGSNGVLVINTDRATDMETKVEFETVNGLSFLPREIPILDAGEFRNYLNRVTQTVLSQDAIYRSFPFLRNDPSYGISYYAYNHNTNWQKEVFSPAFTTENILKVKGGDAIAKYSLLAGYMRNAGIEENTRSDRYFARFNGDMQMNRHVAMFANVGFNYFDNKLHEQGMVQEINPMLTALLKPSVLAPKRVDRYGNPMDAWDPVREFGVSNPAVVVRSVEGTNALYNIMVNMGINYAFTPSLRLQGLIGINYDYNREKLFVPGVTTESIVHMEGGKAENMIRDGVGKSMTYHGNLNLNYAHSFKNGHYLDAAVGAQLFIMDHLYEFAKGLNTATDYDKMLSSVQDANGKYMTGYDEPWRWSNLFANVNYNYNKQWYAGVGLSMDASSMSGEHANLFNFYPAVNIAWNMANASFLRESGWLELLTLRAEYSQKGNAMFPSMLSKYYYTANSYQMMGGLIRANIPNDKLKPEVVESVNAGLNFRTTGNWLNLTFNYYQDKTKDMILPENLGSAFGSKYRYANCGEMKTNGVELGLNATVLRITDFEWNLGATIAHEKTKVTSLGDGVKERIITLTDGAEIITRVGESPYQFFGLEATGVYATTALANEAGLKDFRGVNYRAGDMRYRDFNGDKTIDRNDKVVIGDPNPDFYGGIFTSFRYKAFTLSAQFTYSYGNDIYNAVRRVGESMSTITGQMKSVKNSWYYEGHQTDMPRAEFSDPMNNSGFSSRWIEDGSYLKLKNLTLNYEHPAKLWIFTKFQAYVTAENLFTCTKYLGYDPEFAYSYDPSYLGVDYGKVPGARTFKLGIRLGF